MSRRSRWRCSLSERFAGLVCGFLNTVASSGSAVSLPILMMMGLDPIAANATNRLGVLVGAMTATGTFQRANQIPWRMALRVLPSVTLGSAVGALLAEYIPARDLGIAITAAVLVAFVLLFTKVKAAIESAASAPVHFGIREDMIFFGIGVWLGFIVLDGATYLLLALVLAVHLPLVQANATKSLALVPSSVMALIMFALDGAVVWSVGAVMAAGSIVGGMLGARVAGSASAKKWVFRLLAAVILGELANLGVHYFLHTAETRLFNSPRKWVCV